MEEGGTGPEWLRKASWRRCDLTKALMGGGIWMDGEEGITGGESYELLKHRWVLVF